MKNNNYQQQQNSQNFALNKNPYRIQNFNYMFYLLTQNPNVYQIPNLSNPLFQLGYIPNYPQAQFQTSQEIPFILPFINNIGYNNLLQLSLLNSGQSLSQNPNLLSNLNNNFHPNFFLNKKTFNPNHQETDKENPNKITQAENNDNNTNKLIEEGNNTSLMKEANESTMIKSDLTIESNKEEKSMGEIEEENPLKESQNIEEKSEKNLITTSVLLEEKNDLDKKETIGTNKKKKKRRNNYKELLYDTILEHIGKEQKQDDNKDMPLEESSLIVTEKEKSKENKKNNKRNKQKQRNNKHSKKQHKITLKNNKDILADLEENKNNEESSKLTKIIFHGNNYKETKNVNEFMKYNFDFSVDEQYTTKKLITDYTQQHVNINSINGNKNIYENYNYSEQHLDEIKNKWSREKFLGDNKELKKAINTIRDSFNERKLYTNEEKYLDIIKNNNYSIDVFENKKN